MVRGGILCGSSSGEAEYGTNDHRLVLIIPQQPALSSSSRFALRALTRVRTPDSGRLRAADDDTSWKKASNGYISLRAGDGYRGRGGHPKTRRTPRVEGAPH